MESAERWRTSASARSRRPPPPMTMALLEGWGIRPRNYQFGSVGSTGGASRGSRWRSATTSAGSRRSPPRTTAGDAGRLRSVLHYRSARSAAARWRGLRDRWIAGHQARLVRQDGRLRQLSRNYGDSSNYWHGVDINVNARLTAGLTLQGGTSTGRRVADACEIATSCPRHPLFTVATEPAIQARCWPRLQLPSHAAMSRSRLRPISEDWRLTRSPKSPCS